MAPTFFTSLWNARISARALVGSCGSEPWSSCALLAAMEVLRLTQAFQLCGCIKRSAFFQPGQYRGCMASRFCPCGVRHQRRALNSDVNSTTEHHEGKH